MANAKQVLDIRVSKGITTAQSNEHLRNRSEKAAEYAMKKGNYDPTREHLKSTPCGQKPEHSGTHGRQSPSAWY